MSIAEVLANRRQWWVECADALTALAELPTGSIDAIVTDPPYELSFMSRKWDGTGIAFSVDLWAEALRVLKPGGHLLAFGGTRTYHRMACAIEDAGFEIRDSIHWIYGSGFPKSLDVSKAIDKAAGVSRARIRGVRSGIVGPTYAHDKWSLEYKDSVLSTEPLTDLARQWDGWGTALKPAHEMIVLARKPLIGTVAANVLAHGTGALNVDACRVASADNRARFNRSRVDGSSYVIQKRDALIDPGGDGRWPPNVLLSHHTDCREVGTRRIKTKKPAGTSKRESSGYDGGWGDRQAFDYTDADGYETIVAWECVDGCPVAELDRQSGDRPTGGRVHQPGDKFGGRWKQFEGRSDQHSRASHYQMEPSDGGTSRFFPIFRYEPKADSAERNAGLEYAQDAPDTSAVPMDGTGVGEGKTPDAPVVERNTHPCVKPVALMLWLCRLITPPNGVILDLFTGSGTTGVAALRGGFRFVGIEREADYAALSRARIQGDNPLFNTPLAVSS